MSGSSLLLLGYFFTLLSYHFVRIWVIYPGFKSREFVFVCFSPQFVRCRCRCFHLVRFDWDTERSTTTTTTKTTTKWIIPSISINFGRKWHSSYALHFDYTGKLSFNHQIGWARWTPSKQTRQLQQPNYVFIISTKTQQWYVCVCYFRRVDIRFHGAVFSLYLPPTTLQSHCALLSLWPCEIRLSVSLSEMGQ